MVIVAADVRNGGTWAMQCIERIIDKPMLFQPFEGVGAHSDSVKPPLPPVELVNVGSTVCREMEFYCDCEAPQELEDRYAEFVNAYMNHRSDAGGMKVTCNLPSVVNALGVENVVVLRIMRNIVDAALSTWQHWSDSEWIRSRIEGVKSRWVGEEGWSEAHKLYSCDRVLAERMMMMWCSRRSISSWMQAKDGLRWLDVSMERLSASPIYAAPQIADLLEVDASKVADVFGSAREPVFSYPPLRTADEIRRVEQIADQLGVDRL